ncbi:MAG TPA: AEC family transporter, partial [Oceanipulchritudo sp.]|nr:AEC family transporter [Oceanipulchritudo sp.]
MSLPISTILGAALPVFILLGLGFGLRRFKVLSQEAESSLLKVVVSVFYPCLFLAYIIGNPALKAAPNLVAAPLVGFFTVSGGFLVAYVVARGMGLKRGSGLRTFSFCNGIYNYGYIPIPVIMVLFGDRETMGVLLVHNVGVEAAIWTVGIMLLSGHFRKGALKQLINPVVL